MSPTPSPAPCVLLVEDDAAQRATLRSLLEAEGFEVGEAADGVEGLRRALARPPDAVLSDVDMPLLDGYALAGLLRDVFGGGPLLVAVTAYGDEPRAREAGFDHVVAKPADPARLVGLLRGARARPPEFSDN
jgi:CheY-like chemotaxis protein